MNLIMILIPLMCLPCGPAWLPVGGPGTGPTPLLLRTARWRRSAARTPGTAGAARSQLSSVGPALIGGRSWHRLCRKQGSGCPPRGGAQPPPDTPTPSAGGSAAQNGH